jgi:3-methyladenine DNA glycosylase AlkD
MKMDEILRKVRHDLKEASKPYQKAVFDYVMKNKAVMSRTALRYAIEKMPPELRTKAMAK